MRAKKSRETNIFSASVVDLFASGLGVFLIVSIIALVNQKKNESKLEQKLEVEKNEEIAKVLERLEKKQSEILKLKAQKIEDLSVEDKIKYEKAKKELQQSFSEAKFRIAELKQKEEIKKLKDQVAQLQDKNNDLETENIDLKASKGTEGIFGDKLTTGKRVRLDNVHFFPGTARPIEPYATREVKVLAKSLKKSSAKLIEVSGHIYQSKRSIEKGEDDDPTNISGQRADVVCDMLVNEGIDRDRLQCVGYAAKRYLYLTDDDTSVEAQFNRRVEVEILK